MILRIRNSKTVRAFSLFMVVIFLSTLNPLGSYALTGGPAQPEFNSFTPIGTSDMVDLASGDFSYNIPLMDIGGFPINLAYNSGVTMDQEASWVGLGWDLSIGQINRQMRGLPDDFDGDKVIYENNMKDNWTVGGTFQFSPELFDYKLGAEDDPKDSSGFLKATIGISGQYNSYTGYSFSPSFGMSYTMANGNSTGFNASSSPDGLVLSPSLSLASKSKEGQKEETSVSFNSGLSFNSRQGLTNVNLSTSISSPTAKAIEKLKNSKISGSSIGSSVSFVPNTYTPSVQTNMTALNRTFNAALGQTYFGTEGENEVTAFFSNQFIANKLDIRSTYGYEHTEEAPYDAVLDFNREKDGVFSVNSGNLPLTNYTYDIYSVQGQGVSGMFHPYRSQVGYVYDNKMVSNSSGLSGGAEFEAGGTAGVGTDIEGTYSSNKSGIWKNGNNKVLKAGSFEESPESETPRYEEVYFKNVGDLSVDQEYEAMNGEGTTTRLGDYDPIRFKVGYIPYQRTLKNKYMRKGEHDIDPFGVPLTNGWEINKDEIKRSERVNRNQNIIKVTADEAENLTSFTSNFYAKPHHTAGFVVTRNDGARYNYGKTLYNTSKKEVTFAVGDEVGQAMFGEYGANGNTSTGLVPYEADVDNSLDNGKGDHYFNRITTPAYGHTYLLTSLVSTDYSDVDAIEGPSAGDFGSYTNFTYRDMEKTYNWRVPFQENKANYNEGLKTDPTDDKGSYVYGQKEVTYIKKIETKTHVAIFHISQRHDGYGVEDENGGMPDDLGTTGSKMYQLDRIALYSRGEYYHPDVTTTNDDDSKENIVTDATPIKTVHFEYDYELCQNIPNNDDLTTDYNGDGADINQGGKLTLKKIYFTYRNSNMGQYSPYEFAYGDIDHNGTTTPVENEKRNPNYNLKGYDIWGCYKENAEEILDGEGLEPLSELTAPEFNYVEQTTTDDKSTVDDNAAAWSITDISLPSGGEIQIDYEADDYQYVQDKKAMRMFKLAGAGSVANPILEDDDHFDFETYNPDAEISQTNKEALLYKNDNPALYLYFLLDEEDQNLDFTNSAHQAIFKRKYVQDIYDNQKGLLQFRMLMNMTSGGGVKLTSSWDNKPFDYVSGYAELDNIDQCTFFQGEGPDTQRYGSIKLQDVKMEGGFTGLADVSPLSKAGWQYARRYLSQYVYGLPALEDGVPAGAALESIYQAFENLTETVTGANALLKSKKISRRFIKEKSWIRLSEPTQHKKGGGCRVKQIAMTDEWANMLGDPDPESISNQKYGQVYSYELKEGGSSGVATYEPVGSKENPWVQPVYVNTNRLLAPDDQNYVEKPFGESFFPNPSVTYSRVSVKNLERNHPDTDEKLIKHATGEVVTEFYTSKDYPTITDQTHLRLEEDSNPLLSAVFSINVVKHLTLSQGYSVHINDMNGKMKNQRVYAEGQEDFISGVDYNYDLNGPEEVSDQFSNKGRLDNNVWAMNVEGTVANHRLGVEQNIVNDFREMKSTTQVAGVDLSTQTFAIGPVVMAVPAWFPKYSRHVTKLNLATTTKVINTYGVLRETVAYDAGASVSTKNKLWDTETGAVLITETVNEYDDHYYSFNFPAHWHYKGMGQASFNSGIEGTITPEGAGYKLTGASEAKEYFQPGDELLVSTVDGTTKAWVNSVDETGPVFSLIDSEGTLIDILSGKIKIVRSGRRNLQSTSMGSIVLQGDPMNLFIDNGDETYTFRTGQLEVSETALEADDNYWNKKKIANAGAVEFRENWDLQCECGIDPENETYNAYRYNMLGVWRANRSHLYLTGRKHNLDKPNPRYDGFYSSYNSFYTLDETGKWIIPEDIGDTWTFTSEVTQFSPYGFELENADALARYSAAQYGYNFSFPLAVAANSEYSEMGFDGFEDYDFDGCEDNEHFGFRGALNEDISISPAKSHTGKNSLKVSAGRSVENIYRIECSDEPVE